MVGFNCRFAPLLVDLKQQLSRLQGPKAFVYTCNAGAIPADHWTQDPAAGGGRLLGEACHFVDLLRYLAASPIDDLQLLNAADRKPCPDTFSLQLRFADGSIGTVHYFANGSKAFPKERLEVLLEAACSLDNFRKLQAWGGAVLMATSLQTGQGTGGLLQGLSPGDCQWRPRTDRRGGVV